MIISFAFSDVQNLEMLIENKWIFYVDFFSDYVIQSSVRKYSYGVTMKYKKAFQ